MENEEIVAMAICAIAEELKKDIKRIRVISFEEESNSCLKEYLEKQGITFIKYQLGDHL